MNGMIMADLYRRLLDKIGRGGIKCECCKPSSRNKLYKRRIVRQIKHKVKTIIKRIDQNGNF
jgi:hypothetical protein